MCRVADVRPGHGGLTSGSDPEPYARDDMGKAVFSAERRAVRPEIPYAAAGNMLIHEVNGSRALREERNGGMV